MSANGGGKQDHRFTFRSNRGGHNKNGNKKTFEGPSGWRCKSRAPEPKWHLLKEGEAVAFDCEGIDLLGRKGNESKGLSSLAIVNEKGQVMYDPFAYYPEGTPWKFPSKRWVKTNVHPNDVKKENGARPIDEIVENTRKIFDLAGRIVAHAVHNDFNMLTNIGAEEVSKWWETDKVRDTQIVPEWRKYGAPANPAQTKYHPPGLKALAAGVLNKIIQEGDKGHSAIEDARITMELYLSNKESIEENQSVGKQAARRAEIEAEIEADRAAWDAIRFSGFEEMLGPLEEGEYYYDAWTTEKRRYSQTYAD